MAIAVADQRVLDVQQATADAVENAYLAGGVDPYTQASHAHENIHVGSLQGWAIIAQNFSLLPLTYLYLIRGLGELVEDVGGPTIAATGTFLATPTEAEVVAGGQTIILTLTGAEWLPAGDCLTDAVRRALTVQESEATGWNALIRAVLTDTEIVRTSATVVTITLPAAASYAIDADETLDIVVPRHALADPVGPVDVPSTYTIVAA